MPAIPSALVIDDNTEALDAIGQVLSASGVQRNDIVGTNADIFSRGRKHSLPLSAYRIICVAPEM